MMELISADELFADSADNLPQLTVAVCSHGLFVDQLKSLQSQFPPSATFSFILGFDTISRLFNHEFYKSSTVYETMSQLFVPCCSVVVFNRPTAPDAPSSMQELQDFVQKAEVLPFAASILLIESRDPIMLSTSSTLIRKFLVDKQMNNAKELMLPAIAQYVLDHGLYTLPD
eukprot:c8764_g1_i3.p1 GENE.c8764_g1_i3~~c8764_g1_i3.p1  ORF type:complete len:172 (+),score=44.75 c8764_g1_i3:429-944(+)